jgi:carboxyl-terminal processing protease
LNKRLGLDCSSYKNKKTMKRALLYSISIFFGFLIAFLAGYLIRGYFNISQHPNFPVLNQAHNLLLDYGLAEIPDERSLEYGMIRGMLQVYADPYSIFVEPAQHELESNYLQGDYGGIGVDLEKDANGKVFIFPYPDSPAEKAGIFYGDQLFSVENLEIETSTNLDTILAAIRGEEGDYVTLTIGRAPDFSPVKKMVIREKFPLPSITTRIHPDENRLGIIKINLIAASTPQEIDTAFKDLKKRGATHFILDLRNNSGGLLSAGVDTTKLFLSEGTILQQQYKGKDVETISVETPGVLTEDPLVVLINSSTASAAEIIAGALKQNKRAVLIGEPSYGKDSIQLVFDLEDGSSLHITSAKWWIPGLAPAVGGNGVEPDMRIKESTAGPDSMIESARRYFFP